MRLFLIVFALLPLVCACGGGGVGPGGDTFTGYLPNDDPNQSADEGPIDLPLDADAVKAILAQCVVPDVQDVLDVLDVAKGLLTSSFDVSDVEVSNIDILNVSADFAVDLDGDGDADLTGSLQAVDEDGSPTLPVPLSDLLDLMNGTADPFDVVNKIENGTRILVVFEYDELVTLEGNLDIEWQSGWPYEADGEVEVVKDACGGTISFEDIGYEIWDGTYPTCTVDLEFDTSEGTLSGTLTADGTDTALLEFTLDGQDWTFEVDLDTGALTEVE